LLTFGIILFNFLNIVILIKHWINNLANITNYIKKIKLIKTF